MNVPKEVDQWLIDTDGDEWRSFIERLFGDRESEWVDAWNRIPGVNAISIFKAAEEIEFPLTEEQLIVAVVQARLLS